QAKERGAAISAKSRRKGPHTSIARITFKKTVKPLPKEPETPKPEMNVSLFNLEDGMCKWPVGDDLYCGCPTENARVSYCDHHRNSAKSSSYTPEIKKRPFRRSCYYG